MIEMVSLLNGLTSSLGTEKTLQATRFSIRFASGKQRHKRVSGNIKESGLEPVVLTQYPLSES